MDGDVPRVDASVSSTGPVPVHVQVHVKVHEHVNDQVNVNADGWPNFRRAELVPEEA